MARSSELHSKVLALTFSPDAQSIAIADDKTVCLWKVDQLLHSREKEVDGEPPFVPLEVEFSSRRNSYPLALGGNASAEFARKAATGDPSSPLVDLALVFRNKGDDKLTFFLPGKHELDFYLVGQGAMNYPERECQTGYQRSDEVILAPRETFTIPINSLDSGYFQRAYWLLPGEYTLYVRGILSARQNQPGRFGIPCEWKSTRLRVSLRLNVVAETK
jgi:hypothetical protein